MLRTGRRTLGAIAVAAVAAGGLVTTAATGAFASPGVERTSARGKVPTAENPPPTGQVIPDEERNNMLLLIEHGASLAETHTTGHDQAAPVAAVAQPRGARTVGWTQTGTGALINQNGSTLIVSAVHNSIDGDGAVVATLTLNGNGGTDTAVRYQANGVGRFEETFSNGAPDANGVMPFTGSGKCTGGTGVHKNEKCSYTTTGTYNPNTSVVSFNITGTTTR
jgi:hypothetical protein